MGDTEKALDTLAMAVEQGWRSGWRLQTRDNDNLVSLHADPRYQAIIADIEAQMSTQLALVRTQQTRGLLPGN